jgi:beta-aspartyl-dipeptidase (metallo-type)
VITLIEGGELFTPEARGRSDVVVIGEQVAKVGSLDAELVRRGGLEVELLDARDRLVIPGLIDPHEHLLGGSGERGFASQTPELGLREILEGGITTVVGCLGVDATTKTMTGLLAKVRAFEEEGLTARLYTGGYPVPPTTLTGSVRSDMLLVPEVIGAGEVAIADSRSSQPSVQELARIASDAHVGGILTNKAGVVHFHVGDGKLGLQPLRQLLDDYEIAPTTLYPTHVERNERLMREAIALTLRGVTVDVDTVEEDLLHWFRFFVAEGGALAHLTVSSDASIPSPRTLFTQLQQLVLEGKVPLERALPCFTRNTARVLKLTDKGRIEAAASADLVVLERGTLEIVHVMSRGRVLVRDGKLTFLERFLEKSNRRLQLNGKKA